MTKEISKPTERRAAALKGGKHNAGKFIADYQKNIRKNNAARILAYYRADPFATVKHCAADLDLSEETVRKLIRMMRKERV